MADHSPTARQYRLTALVILAATALYGAGAAGGADSANVVAIEVSDGPSLPTSVAGHVGGLVKGVPVIAGGNRWTDHQHKRWLHESFVFRGGKWSDGPPMPQPLSDSAFAWDQSGLYVAGGTDGTTPTNIVLRLNDPASTWEKLSPLPAPLESSAGAISGNTFYVCTGFSEGKASDKLLALDLRNPTAGWKTMAPFPGAGRAYAGLVAIGPKLYLLGGVILPPYQRNPHVFADAYIYDTQKNSWAVLPSLNYPGYAWTATDVGGEQIMLTGRAPDIGVINNDIAILDLASMHVKVLGQREDAGCCFPVIPCGERTWLMPGGEPSVRHNRSDRTSIVKLKTAD